MQAFVPAATAAASTVAASSAAAAAARCRTGAATTALRGAPLGSRARFAPAADDDDDAMAAASSSGASRSGAGAGAGARGARTTATATAAKGAPAPDFTGRDQAGNAVSLADFRGKSALVLFFYPKAFTPGCTRQACAFRDAADEFAGLDAAIVGVSAGTTETMASFGETHGFKYPLLADEDNKIRKAYGVPSTLGFLPGRVTYVIDKDGIIIEIFNSQLNVDEHVKVARNVLAAAKAK